MTHVPHHSIYAIRDSEGRVRYVGCTSGLIEDRAREHRNAKKPLSLWMRENAWTVTLMETVPWSGFTRELRVIEQYRETGQADFNIYPRSSEPCDQFGCPKVKDEA